MVIQPSPIEFAGPTTQPIDVINPVGDELVSLCKVETTSEHKKQ